MRSLLGALSSIALAGIGLLSIASFTLTMLAMGNLGWLVIGWFALPVTVLIWPVYAGMWWAGWFYGIFIVGGGIASWAKSANSVEPSYRR